MASAKTRVTVLALLLAVVLCVLTATFTNSRYQNTVNADIGVQLFVFDPSYTRIDNVSPESAVIKLADLSPGYSGNYTFKVKNESITGKNVPEHVDLSFTSYGNLPLNISVSGTGISSFNHNHASNPTRLQTYRSIDFSSSTSTVERTYTVSINWPTTSDALKDPKYSTEVEYITISCRASQA